MSRDRPGCLILLLTGGLFDCLLKTERPRTQSTGETDAEASTDATAGEGPDTMSTGTPASTDAETEPATPTPEHSSPQHAESHHVAGTVVARVPLDRASDIAISRNGVVYVARLNAGLARAQLPDFAFAPIVADGSATSVAFGPMGATAYVAGLGGPLAFVDVETDEFVTVVGGGTVVGTPLACAVSADGATAILGVGGAAYTIDVATCAISTSMAIPGGVEHISVHPGAPLFYATASAAGHVLEVNLETQTIVRTFMLGGMPRGSVVSPDGTTLYVANDDGHIDFVELASATVARVPLGTRGAFRIALSPDGTRAYVTSPWSGTMRIVDVSARSVLHTAELGGEPRGIAVSPDGHTVAVANESGWVDFIQ